MKAKESVKEFTERVLRESQLDIDIEYCKARNIKYKNHEIDSDTVELFTTKSNKAAFDFVTKAR